MASINGKKISQYILKEQKKIIDEYHLTPSLATILIGNDEASRIYTQEKRKKATKIGVKFSSPSLTRKNDEVYVIKKNK